MSNIEPSIFTKIINGEIPSHKVYEDEQSFAFMDIYPIQEGMVLVIPKEEIDNFEDLPDDLMQAVMITTKKVMRALRNVFPDKRKIGVQIEGLDVPHAHVKIFPINSGADYHAHAPTEDPDHEKLAELARKIKENIPSSLETSDHPGKSRRDAEVSLPERSEPEGSASEGKEVLGYTDLDGDLRILNEEGKGV